MAKQKDLEFNTRGRSVNINNIKTHNTKHIAHNTTYAAKATPKKLDVVATPPSVTGIRDAVPHLENQMRTALENEVIENRKQRDAKQQAKHSEFKDEKAELRKKMQAGKERDARNIINADYLHRIEVSVHKKSTSASVRLNIDVLQEPGYFQKFKAVCQNRRARDIMQSVPPKYKDWEGYEYAKEAIRDGANAGKICIRQNSAKQTQIAAKAIPKAVAIFNSDTFEVEILLGDKTYTIQLEEYNSEYFGMKGCITKRKRRRVDGTMSVPSDYEMLSNIEKAHTN